MNIEIENKELNVDFEQNNLGIESGVKKIVQLENDYKNLKNKPSINGVELTDNKTTKDLGIEAGAKNIVDEKNNSLKANDINTNIFRENGYFDDNGEYIQLTSKPTIITSINDTITSLGYYVAHNSLISEDGINYTLVEPKVSAIGKKVYQMLANPSRYGTVLTRDFRIEPNNSNIFGSKNESLGDNATTVGKENGSTGDYNFVSGHNNNVVGHANFVGGEHNVVEASNVAIFGAENTAGENQGVIGGYRNRILDGAYFGTVFGVGNITKGTGTTAHGGYNLAGSEYCSVDGMDNIAGGNVTFDGVELAEISRYSASTNYTTGKMCKRNGYVFKALKSVTGVTPEPNDEEGNWEVVEPVVTEDYARCAKASGEKCKSTHNGSFTHGYYLISGRDNQTVLGKYNNVVDDAIFVVGNGTSVNSRKNIIVAHVNNIVEILGALEIEKDLKVLQNLDVTGVLNTLGGLNVIGSTRLEGNELIIDSPDSGDKSLVISQKGEMQSKIRTNASGQTIFEGTNGVYIRPFGANSSGIKFDNNYVIPERNEIVSLGSAERYFKNVYLSGALYDSNGNSVIVKQIATTQYVDKKIGDIEAMLKEV